MQCVVLAGGMGTRMLPLTRDRPKALLPVAGRPFADWQLDLLAAQGFTDVVYSVGHLGGMLRAFVGDGARWGVRVAWSDEGDELRGTGGALRLALDAGRLEPDFAVVYGDSFLPIAVDAVRAAFVESGLPALMTVYCNEGRFDTSNVRFEHDRVVAYRKGGPDPQMRFIDAGVGWLARDVITERVPADTVVDLATVYGVLSAEGLLAGFELHERFYEVGSPEGLEALERYLASGAWPSSLAHLPRR
jgi:NDP-sugar pyrophosphorylase family protein